MPVGKEVPSYLPAMLLEFPRLPPGIRHLSGISRCPIVRADGSVHNERGYDAETHLYYDGSALRLDMPDAPSHADAVRAVQVLRDLVADFPLRDAHFASWLSLPLTLAGRHLIDGPTPLFAIDGNTRGVGKGLLADVAALIVSFGRAPSQVAGPREAKKDVRL